MPRSCRAFGFFGYVRRYGSRTCANYREANSRGSTSPADGIVELWFDSLADAEGVYGATLSRDHPARRGWVHRRKSARVVMAEEVAI
jgi:hypothetical protein